MLKLLLHSCDHHIYNCSENGKRRFLRNRSTPNRRHFQKHLLERKFSILIKFPEFLSRGRSWQIVLITVSAPNHYPNRCWRIVDWTLRIKLQLIFTQNLKNKNHWRKCTLKCIDVAEKRRHLISNTKFPAEICDHSQTIREIYNLIKLFWGAHQG